MNTGQQVRLTENIDQQADEDMPISMTSSSDMDVLTLLTQQLLRMQEDADRERRRRDEKEDRDRKATIERDERFRREAEDRESRIREQALEDAKKRDARFLELQQELEERRQADAKRDREEREVKQWQSKVHTILTWKDQDDPDVYIQQFERWMAIHKVPKTAWAELLPNVLEGKVRTIYHTDISDADVCNYDKVKELLLAALGSTVDECCREYWSLKQLPKESVIDMAVRVKCMTTRYCKGCTTVETVAEQMALGRFLSMLPPGIAAQVRREKPKTTTEAARMAHTITKDRAEVKEAYWNKPKDNNRKPYFERKDTSPKPESSHVSSNTKGESEDTSNADSGPFSWMKCYGCGQKGHKRSESPKKVLRIITPKQEKDLFITGKVGKHTITHLMKVDTGAQVTVVHPKLTNDDQYTGTEIGLNLVELGYKRVPVATAQIEVGELQFKLNVAVLDIAPDDVLHGMDIGKSKYMVDLAHKQAQQTQEKSAAVLLTRNQKKKQQDQSAAEEKAAEDSGAQLNDIFQFDDELFTELDPAVNNCSDLQEEVIPLPALADDDDKRVLIDQQRTDDKLRECRQKADSLDKGYSWKDELLVHTGEDVLGQTTTQIVLHVDRSKTVLEMAHSSLLGGHLGAKKTKAMVNRHFTWPGLGKDVATWCKVCERCQLIAKHSSKVAPLHPLPVITEPFHKLAFDLVGPLPRTKRGHKFILTTMDYGTKLPDAVPLRKVDAETVATAMVDIFSRYGLPREILTDQGTVFTTSLICQLCKLLQITRVKTSPYHPQTDGMLERWHPHLKACSGRREIWVKNGTTSCLTAFSRTNQHPTRTQE